MKNLLRSEELAQFLLCLVALIVMDVPWWVYPILVLGPDIGMLGYLVNTHVGAIAYNVLHHKGIAILMGGIGVVLGLMSVHGPEFRSVDTLMYLAAIILYGHACMDRIFGYGLKFGDNFHHTHLGWIGSIKEQG